MVERRGERGHGRPGIGSGVVRLLRRAVSYREEELLRARRVHERHFLASRRRRGQSVPGPRTSARGQQCGAQPDEHDRRDGALERAPPAQLGAPSVVSNRCQVAGNVGPPAEVAMMPTARPRTVLVSQAEGMGSGPPRAVSAPATPPVVMRYRAWTVAAAGSTVR